MSADTIRDDLAFMRSLAESGGRTQWAGGAIFVAGGTLYGLQCLVQWTQAAGLIVMSPPLTLSFIIGITVVFLIALGTVIVRGRKSPPHGITNKAFTSIFQATGIANLALVGVFAAAAIPRHSIIIWELYPAALFALQGAAWYVVFQLRRRLWLAMVSAGWFVSAIALGLLAGTLSYVLVAALALFAFMAVPGAYMMRLARKAV